MSASGYDDTIAWYENDGAESFTEHVISNSADFARSVFAIDLDGDGDVDALSASAYDHKIAWYENDCGTSAPTAAPSGAATHLLFPLGMMFTSLISPLRFSSR